MTTATAAEAFLPDKAAAEAPFKPFVLILSGCDPTVNPETLFNLIDPIASHNIPVGFAVEANVPDADKDAATDYFDRLRGLSADLPGLFELLPSAAGLNDPVAYFLARKAFGVYGSFQATFDAAPNLLPVTLFSPAGEIAETGISGLRSSGFRTVYSPRDATVATDVRQQANGIMSVTGGILADVTQPSEDFRSALDAAIAKDDVIFVNLSLSRLSGLSPDRAFQQGSELAVTMARRKALSQIVANLPRDFHLRMAGGTYNRAVSVCVDMSRADDDIAAAYAEFAATLESRSITVTQITSSVGPTPGVAPDSTAAAPPAGETCSVLRAGLVPAGVGMSVNGGDRLRCAAMYSTAAQEWQVAFAIGLSTLLDLSGDGNRASGLDDTGILRVPATAVIPGGSNDVPVEIAGKLPDLLGNHRDAIIVIDARSLATVSARSLIFGELSNVADQPWSTFETLSGYSNTVVPDYNHLELIRQSKFDRFMETRALPEEPAADSSQQMEYARQAWQYFANETHERTGFTPATVFRSEDFSSNYEDITMWDVASHLNGLLCVSELGIIPRDEMLDRVRLILKNLPERKILGLNLPVAEFHFASRQPLSAEYHSCDIGRLLVSLHVLRGIEELRATVEKVVAGWDLAGTIKDGQIKDITRQRFVDASDTNCAHYASIGYGLWGFEFKSPYRTAADEGAFDRGVRLLDAVGKIGPLGAEPLLLEEVELGFSPESKILSDILYSAQLSEFRRSGHLVAVSETPLDREPWFTYQGLDVNDADAPWKVTSISNQSRFRTAGFAYANRLLSTKAAMLWGAVRPSAFSGKLVDRAVRDTIVPDLGFAVGVYHSTDQPTFGYSGMNTNGIILESIAYALRGRKPMSEASF